MSLGFLRMTFGGGTTMNPLPSTGTATLLQKGIAATRAGRSDEARQLFRQVVTADPDNEMAWLWLSGLVTTNEEKRACLERVLLANPENVYARAGLERLQGTPPPVTAAVETDILEARLASVTGGLDFRPPAAGPPDRVRPAVKRLESSLSLTGPATGQPKEERAAVELMELPQPSAQVPPDTDPEAAPDSFETTCPACDQPISPADSRCPHCFIPFNSLEELLARSVQVSSPAPAQPLKPRRKGILGLLGAIIAS
jgi:hypothetical protein